MEEREDKERSISKNRIEKFMEYFSVAHIINDHGKEKVNTHIV